MRSYDAQVNACLHSLQTSPASEQMLLFSFVVAQHHLKDLFIHARIYSAYTHLFTFLFFRAALPVKGRLHCHISYGKDVAAVQRATVAVSMLHPILCCNKTVDDVKVGVVEAAVKCHL